MCCRKATAQILFLGYAPYPFQNFDSDLENTPPPPCLFRQKESAGHSRRRKSIFRLIWNPSYPTGCTIPHLHHGCGDHPFNHYARFWCRFAEHGQRGKCLARSPILGASWSCKMGGVVSLMTRFFHFWAYVVYIMPYNVNGISPFLQVCSRFPARFRTFHDFLSDTPGLLWSAVGVQCGAGGDFAERFRLNRAKPGTLSPRGCCGVL